MTSRSRKVSRPRRTLPAPDTSTAAGCARSASTTSRTTGRPTPRRPRRSGSGPNPFASASRMRSSLFAPSPWRPRTRCCSAACRSSSSVVTPSSRQILAAVFGPSPGSRRNWRTSAGTSALRFSSADIEPVSVISTIFASIVAPIPGSSFAVPCERQLRDGRAGLADPRRRPAVGEDAESLLPEDLRHVGELVQRVGDVGVAGKRRHPSIIGTSPSQPERADSADEHDARSRLRPDLQRAGQRRAARARARRRARHEPRPRARDRRRFARRHGRDRRPPRGGACVARRPPPHGEGGDRPRVPRGLRSGARGRC